MSVRSAACAAACIILSAALASCASASAADFHKKQEQEYDTKSAAVTLYSDENAVTEIGSQADDTSADGDSPAVMTDCLSEEAVSEDPAPESGETEDEQPPEEEPPQEEQPEEEPDTIEELDRSLLDGHYFTACDFPGYVRSNKKFSKAVSKIDRICADYGGSISFIYLNCDTGAAVYYRPDERYGTCSTIKAAYCEYLLESGIDLDEKILITDIWGGDQGTIADEGCGREYTAKQLIRLAITESDNSAYLTLVNRYGRDGFNAQNEQLGVYYRLDDGYIFTECSARDLMKQFAHIYELAWSNERIGWLTRLMQKTDMEEQITAQLAGKYPVSHKYGTDHEQDCYHDCAICYADSPFILVIMTRQIPETPESNKVFKKLAKQFDILNGQLIK